MFVEQNRKKREERGKKVASIRNEENGTQKNEGETKNSTLT